MIITVKVQDMVLYKSNVMRVLRAIRSLNGMGLRDARNITQSLKEGKESEFEIREDASLHDLEALGINIIAAKSF